MYLKMAAALLVPLFADVTASLGAAGVEMGLSSAVSEAAAAGVVGAGVTAVGNEIDKAAVGLIGEDRVKNIQDKFNDLINAEKALNTQDPAMVYGLKTGAQTFHPVTRSNKPETITPQPPLPLLSSESKEVIGQVFEKINTSNFISPREIASHIISNANTIVQNLPENANAYKPPVPVSDLSKTLDNFYKSKIPNTEEYRKIASVYNGRKLDVNQVVKSYNPVTDSIMFSIYDETNVLQVCQENKGFVLPAAYGNFGGPASPNNALCVDLSDLFYMLHDVDYENHGFFDTIGDYKLVSRLSQNFDRLPEQAKAFAKVAILYFSTAGVQIGHLIGSLPKNISRVPSDQMTMDDVFPIARPDAVGLPPQQYIAQRTQFYKELEEEYKIVEQANSAIIPKPNIILAQKFKNILVQIL